MADEVTVNSALCPLQDGITHDIVVGGSSVHKDNKLQYGYGFTGRSKRAAREDHIHPLNINLSFMPFPVGAFPPEGLSNKPNIASAYPGAVGDSNYKTRTYALANHIHSYMFADYIATDRKGAIELFKPLKDGAKWTKAIPFAFVASGKGAVGLEYSLDASNIAGVITENRVEAGFSGMANYPARADHSHPLNVPPSSDGTNKPKPVGGISSNGTSPYYARLDHTHAIQMPESYTEQNGWFVQSVNDDGNNTTLHYRACTVHKTGLVQITGGMDTFNMPSARALQNIQNMITSLGNRLTDLENTVNDIIDQL